jgi:hypothetical protein
MERACTGVVAGGISSHTSLACENVGRSPALDLLYQRRARIVASDDLDTGSRGESLIEVVERILHRRCGKYGDGVVLRMSGDWRGLLHVLPNDENKRNNA